MAISNTPDAASAAATRVDSVCQCFTEMATNAHTPTSAASLKFR